MSTTNAQTEIDRPPFWDWDSEGNRLEGRYLYAGKGQTAQGPRTFVVLDVDGHERTLWLLSVSLFGQFQQRFELHGPIKPGERVIIVRGEKTENQRGDRSYWPFKATWPDAPEPDQADLFGNSERSGDAEQRDPDVTAAELPADPSPLPVDGGDDDTPF